MMAETVCRNSIHPAGVSGLSERVTIAPLHGGQKKDLGGFSSVEI